MIIRNKHNLNNEDINIINNALSRTWLKEIYSMTTFFKESGLAINHLNLGETDKNILYIEDLIRAMKKTLNNELLNKCIFEIAYIDPTLNYNDIKVGSVKFVMKDGKLLKYVANVENLPFKSF